MYHCGAIVLQFIHLLSVALERESVVGGAWHQCTASIAVADAGFLEGGSVIITRAKRARNF